MNETEYKKARARILTRFRQKKHRLLNADTESDGFSGVSPLDTVESAIKELLNERDRELLELEKQYRKDFFDVDPRDKEFLVYEKRLKECGGSSDLYSRKFHGKPKPKKSEFVKLDDRGNIQHNDNVCSRCGKTKANCTCDKQSNEWLRM